MNPESVCGTRLATVSSSAAITRIARHAQDHVRLGEARVEIVSRQVERQGIELDQLPAQRLERVDIGQRVLAEARQVARPFVHGMEAPVGDHVGIVGARARDAGNRLRSGSACCLAARRSSSALADRHVADIMFVDLDRELLVHRLGMETRRLGIGRVDQRLGHAMAGEIIEADILEGEAKLRRGRLGRARFAGEIVRDIDQWNLAVDHRGRRDGRRWYERSCGPLERLICGVPLNFAKCGPRFKGSRGKAA